MSVVLPTPDGAETTKSKPRCGFDNPGVEMDADSDTGAGTGVAVGEVMRIFTFPA